MIGGRPIGPVDHQQAAVLVGFDFSRLSHERAVLRLSKGSSRSRLARVEQAGVQASLDSLPIASTPSLFGADRKPGLVNLVAHKDGVIAYWRRGPQVESTLETFEPFLWITEPDILAGLEKSRKPPEYRLVKLEGQGFFGYLVRASTWNYIKRISSHIAKATGLSASHPRSPQLFISDQTQQYLMSSGRTMFSGMAFEDLRRMQVIVYPNEESEDERPDPSQDTITQIGLKDSSGWSELLKGKEATLLERFVELVRERDPDVLEGHDLFKFHLPFLYSRAKALGVELRLGRGEEKVHYRRSRMFIAEKTLDYNRWYCHGRDLIDSWILAQLFDVSGRDMLSFLRDDVAEHLGKQLPVEKDEGPDEVTLRELKELDAIHRTLSYPYFLQSQIFPYRYEHVVLRGNATRINSLFLREYLRQGAAVPQKPEVEEFAGGLTAQERQGVVKDVFHCDVASLYPSIILAYDIQPEGDHLDVFRGLLANLKQFRLSAKEQQRQASSEAAKIFFGGLQTTFKILINSFYGYLGFAQGNFADFTCAAQVTATGRRLLTQMIEFLKSREATVLEVDTDGIYFTTPDGQGESLVSQLNQELPEGVEVELDGRYPAMYCHKMKNYALLTEEGGLIVKGSGLRSRSLEPYLRSFLQQLIEMALKTGPDQLESLYQAWTERLEKGQIPIEQLAKRETLVESPASYRRKVEAGKRNRAAVYELALQSQRKLVAGDSLRYYITGEKAGVTAYNHACRLRHFQPENPDFNLAYYKKKLRDTYRRFAPSLNS